MLLWSSRHDCFWIMAYFGLLSTLKKSLAREERKAMWKMEWALFQVVEEAIGSASRK